MQLTLIFDDFTISPNFWNDLELIVDVLKIPAEKLATVERDNFGLTDFYGLWLELNLQIDELYPSELINNLKQSLQKREHVLLNNITMVSCIYLDPRFQSMLNDEKKTFAKKHLTKLYNKLLTFQSTEQCDNTNGIAEQVINTTHKQIFEEKITKIVFS